MALWTPANLTSVTLEGWYRVHDPAAVLADGSDISTTSSVNTWADQSGHGRTLTKEGSPTYDANGLSTGHPAVVFPFAGFRTAAGAGYPTSAVIGSMVIGTTTTDGRVTSLNASASTDFGTSGVIPLLQGGSTLTYWYNGGIANTTHTENTTVVIFEGVPLSSTTADVGINTVLSGTPGTITGLTLDRMGLFAESDSGTGTPAGTCAECILWAGVISLTERRKLEGYIAWNNGQQALLPGGHPYAGAAPTLWTPANLTTAPLGWYDAKDFATLTLGTGHASTTNSVVAWNDKSGHAYHLGQSSTTNRPLYVATGLNGMPAVNCDTTWHDFLFNASLPASDPFTIIVLCQRTTGSNAFQGSLDLVGDHSGFTSLGTVSPLADSNYYGRAYAGGWQPVDTVTANPRLYETIIDSTVENYWGDCVPTSSWVISSPSGGFTGVDVGGSNNAGGFSGPICEVIILAGAVSITNRQLLEGYLLWKWGYQARIPVGHPYAGAAPTLDASNAPITLMPQALL